MQQQQLPPVNIREEIKEYEKELIEIRRHIHQYPETQYEEFETAKFIVNKLKELKNIEIIENVGKTGVVGILNGAHEGPCILLRADMDALNLTENSGEEFASKIKGKHHACGHDGHVAMLIIAAKIISKWQDKLHGKIKFCFQPAEEGGFGAEAMVVDEKYPVLENPKVDKAYGIHLYNACYYPDIAVTAGPMNANSHGAKIEIKGKGSSAYLPQYGIDAVYIGTQLTNQLYSISSRNMNPMVPSTLSVGQINGGTASNILAENCKLGVSIRTTNNDDADHYEKRVKEICKGMEKSYNCVINVEYNKKYQMIINDEKAVEDVKQSAGKIAPVYNRCFGLAGEDFSCFSKRVPSAFYIIGSAPEGSIKDNGRTVTVPHHSPLFTIDERCLPLGVSTWLQLVEDQLIKK